MVDVPFRQIFDLEFVQRDGKTVNGVYCKAELIQLHIAAK